MADREFQLVAGNLCLDFINTLDERGYAEREQELLTSYADLLAFLRQSQALPESILRQLAHRTAEAPRALHRAREIRETLYRVFAAIVEGHHPVLEDLDQISGEWRRVSRHFRLRTKENGFEWQWAGGEEETGADRALWPIVRSAVDLLVSRALDQVRMCESETCRWLFLDSSRNHSRRWCDMKVCGNRSKVSRFYQRQRTRR